MKTEIKENMEAIVKILIKGIAVNGNSFKKDYYELIKESGMSEDDVCIALNSITQWHNAWDLISLNTVKLGFEYKRKSGSSYKPLFFSDCKRFVFVECKYSNGVVVNKWMWSCHRIFKTSI
jgi:hypothetical protein